MGFDLQLGKQRNEWVWYATR